MTIVKSPATGSEMKDHHAPHNFREEGKTMRGGSRGEEAGARAADDENGSLQAPVSNSCNDKPCIY
jgi:hypothetical protein